MAKKKGLSFYQKKKKLNIAVIREIGSWIFWICASILLAIVTVYCIGMKTSVIGPSMEPSMYNGQNIFLNRLIYRVSSPKNGDVVVFLPNGNENAHYYVKRVVAVPGQTVLIANGILYVDGQRYGDDSMDLIASAGIAENEILLGEEEYFVLGDNFNNSEDSRSANIGPVRRGTIIGRAWFHFGNGVDGWGLVE